jgi:hypothetical protein
MRTFRCKQIMPNDENWVPLSSEEIEALRVGDEVTLKYADPRRPGSECQFVRAIVAEADNQHGKIRFISRANRESLPDWAEIGKQS